MQLFLLYNVSRAQYKLISDIYTINVMRSSTHILLCPQGVTAWLATNHFTRVHSREEYVRPAPEEDTDKHTVAEPHLGSVFTHVHKHFPKWVRA